MFVELHLMSNPAETSGPFKRSGQSGQRFGQGSTVDSYGLISCHLPGHVLHCKCFLLLLEPLKLLEATGNKRQSKQQARDYVHVAEYCQQVSDCS